MTPVTSTIVLAVACAACAEVSRIPLHNGLPQFRRCSACGRAFTEQATLRDAYRQMQQALQTYPGLIRAQHLAQTALQEALTHWPRKAAKHAICQAVQVLDHPGESSASPPVCP